MKEKKSHFDILSENISKICFTCKDLLLSKDKIVLDTIRKNMVTKIFSKKSGSFQPFVFLTATSYFDTKRMVEVVAAILKSAGKQVETHINISEEFVESFSSYISKREYLTVNLLDDSIFLIFDNFKFHVFDVTNMDRPAKETLTRSLCLGLAFSGKIVDNNIDNYVVNDYGIVKTEIIDTEIDL